MVFRDKIHTILREPISGREAGPVALLPALYSGSFGANPKIARAILEDALHPLVRQVVREPRIGVGAGCRIASLQSLRRSDPQRFLAVFQNGNDQVAPQTVVG